MKARAPQARAINRSGNEIPCSPSCSPTRSSGCASCSRASRPTPSSHPSAWASASPGIRRRLSSRSAGRRASTRWRRIRRPPANRSCAQAFTGWLQRRYGARARCGDAGAAGQRLARGAVRAGADGDRPDARAGAGAGGAVAQSVLSDLRGRGPAGRRRACTTCPSVAARNFAVDWDSVPDAVWARTQLVFVCSPGNPTGAVMPLDEWQKLFALSDRHGFVIAADECYSEIYFRDEPPLGGLEAAARLGRTDFRNLIALTSLSKRSNVPGLRSGFVAGDAAIIKPVPAVPHLPRQRHERRRGGGQHRGLGRRGARGRQPRAVPRQVRRASRRCSSRCSTCACPTPASTSGPACRPGGRATTRPSPASSTLNTM